MANPIASRMAKALRPSAADDVRDTGAGRLALLMAQAPLGHWIGPLANSTGPNSRPFDTKQNILRFIFSNDGVLEVMGGLAEESRQDFASRLRQSVGGPISIAAELLAGKTEATPLAPAASRRLSLWRATFAGTPEDVLDLATQFLEAERSEEALYLKVSSLLALGRIKEAVDYAVEQLLLNQQLHAYLTMNELVAATYFDGTNRFPERLTTPLLLYYYAQYVSSEAMSYRSYSAEDFLFSLGLERPSELQPTAWPGQADLLRTFLWDVCTLSTIRLFTAFDSERSIEDERVKICQILSTWLPDEREVFDDEALSIVRGRLRETLSVSTRPFSAPEPFGSCANNMGCNSSSDRRTVRVLLAEATLFAKMAPIGFEVDHAPVRCLFHPLRERQPRRYAPISLSAMRALSHHWHSGRGAEGTDLQA